MEFSFSVWTKENSGNVVSAPERKGGRRGNGGIGPNQGNGACKQMVEGVPNLGSKDKSHCQEPLCGQEIIWGARSCLRAENLMSKYLRSVKCFSPIVLEPK